MRKIYLVFLILPFLFLTTCGLDRKSHDAGTGGSLKFSVDWKGAPNLLSAAPGIFQAPINCGAGQVETVEATLRGFSDNNVNCFNNNGTCATGPWLCSAHTATISGVQPQNGVKVGIIAKNAIGDVVFYGEAAPVDIVEGQTADVGVITALQIRTLATTTSNPVAVAVDNANVYWIETSSVPSSGAVKSVPLSGGTVTTLAPGLNDLRGIAVDSNRVYWTENPSGNPGVIRSVPISGGTVSTLAGGTNQFNNPQAIVLDSTYVYFTAGDQNGKNGIFKTLLSGGTVTTIVTGLTGNISNIAMDGANIYFAVTNVQASSIMSVPIDGVNATPTVLFPNLTNVQAVAIDATNIYWTDSTSTFTSRFVKKAAKTGGTATPLVTITNGSQLSVLLVDATSVYWPDSFGSPPYLNRVGIDGSGVRRVAPANIQQTGGNNISQNLAIDSTSIYWPEHDAVKIKSVAKQ